MNTTCQRERNLRIRQTVALLVLAGISHPAFARDPDLIALDLEQLMNLKVVTVAKAPQALADAPASLTVLTAADIKAHGYRTLLDALNSIRGLTSSYDRYTNFLGVRGYTAQGQFNSKVLLLIDGYRTNENIFAGAFFGIDAIIDIDLVERIEFVPGPSSAVYGDSAFFGVINVITKSASALNGTTIAAETATNRTNKGRGTWSSAAGENSVSTVLSVSSRASRGFAIPTIDASGASTGRASGLDGSRDIQFFAKAATQTLTFAAVHGSRTKDYAIGSYGTVPGEPGTISVDAVSYLSGEWRDKLDANTDAMLRASFGQYKYDGDYMRAAGNGGRVTNVDQIQGRWADLELQVTRQLSAHRIVAGIDARFDTSLRQKNYDRAPAFTYLDVSHNAQHTGIYVQDEWRMHRDFIVTSGLRFDRYDTSGNVSNPRAGLVYSPTTTDRIKLLYGRAFRAPNAFERDNATPALKVERNPLLQPERITTTELVWESYPATQTRLVALLFNNRMSDLIESTETPSGNFRYDNIGEVKVRGAQVEVEHKFASGLRVRASSSWQDVKKITVDGNFERPVDAPRLITKFNASVPLAGSRWLLGVEAQHTAERFTPADRVAGYTVANLALSTSRAIAGFDVTLSAYNLFDRRYYDPGAAGLLFDRIEQNGREWRAKLVYKF